jgi:MFS family permease
VTALLAGFAVGTTLGGSIAESLDWRACFAAAALAGVAGWAVAAARRATFAT